MTTLTKSVRRSLEASDLVVEMAPVGIRMREKGRRTWFGPIPWARLYLILAQAEADARRRARPLPARAARGLISAERTR